jgi:hypothetical protein
MKKFKEDWNFESDNTLWLNAIKKTFADLRISTKKNNFQYVLNQTWGNSSLLSSMDLSTDKPQLGLLQSLASIATLKKFGVGKVFSKSDMGKYSCNMRFHHNAGLDGRWEVVFALFELVQKWRVGKIPKQISVLSVVDENMFYQQVKVLSTKIVLQKVLEIFKLKADIKFDICISEKLFKSTDPKNNLVRLNYAVMSALLLRPRWVIIPPVTGFTKADSWKLATQTFNVLTAETDLLSTENAFMGSPFFEGSVQAFSQEIWEGLQYLFKLPNEKAVATFYKKLAEERKSLLQNSYLKQEIKVVGVNDFISPSVLVGKDKNLSEIHFLEKLRLELGGKLKKTFLNSTFCYFGEKEKLSKKLNDIYQLFAIINISAEWTSYSNVDHKVLVLVTESDIEAEKILKSNSGTVLIFSKDKVYCKYKNKQIALSILSNPFTFWTDFVGVLKIK